MEGSEAGGLVASSENVVITIRFSKTDQLGKGARIEMGPCVFRGYSDGPLFFHLGGSSLTQHQFWTVTSRVLASMWLAGVKFGTHSLRIVAASAMGYFEGRVRGF